MPAAARTDTNSFRITDTPNHPHTVLRRVNLP